MNCLYNTLLVSILLACLLERTSSLPIINELVKREKSNNPVLIDAINAMTAVESIMVSLRIFTIIVNHALLIFLCLQDAVQPDTDLSEIVESISQLHQWKNDVTHFSNANQVVVELIDLVLNQSCAWVSVQ